MAYDKQPNYHYNSLGGINNKVSPYLNSAMEFLKLENFDFQIPGSLTSRWGSTQYFGHSLSGKVNGLYEFIQTTGESYLYAIAGGTMGFALDNGFSSIYSGVGSSSSIYFFERGEGDLGLSLRPFDFDFDTLQNNAFFANQNIFLKSTGASVYLFGLPEFQPLGSTTPMSIGSSGIVAGFSGFYYYKMAFVNSYGLAGAPNPTTTHGMSGILLPTPIYYPAIQTQGATAIFISARGLSGLPVPNMDITGVALFRSLAQGTTVAVNQIDNLAFYLAAVEGVTPRSIGVTFMDRDPQAGVTIMNGAILPWNWYTFDGASYQFTENLGFGITLIPKFIETFDNRLFSAGMSFAPSTFYFSEDGEPENFQPDFNIEVRTNDGEPISALKAYNGNMIVFKPSSFHSLNTSDAFNPSNWSLTQISAEYGCLSNRAVAEYNDLLVFLDRKGIIRFNGANIEILSTKVDPIFQRMNVAAAKSQALMTYDKQRNQILCEIPVDGATMNNLTVVWDMISNCWTTYSGYHPGIITVGQGALTNDQIFMGGYSGLISYFGASFTSDNGVGFTCIAKSGFAHDMGYATESLFRRLYSDMVPQGASAFVDVNFYQDYGASIVFGATIAQTPFQTKIEMGIPARSLSVEYVKGGTFAMTLHGFTIEARYLRNI